MSDCNHRFLTAVLASVLISGAIGCGQDGPSRYTVSGTVTHQGKPIPAGVIQFDPDTTKGHDGPQGYASIRDGKYDTAETDMSPVGGPHTVRITGYDGHSAPELPMGKPLFSEYTQSVELPEAATTVDFEVPVAEEK